MSYESGTRACPRCGKDISAKASRCKHCLESVEPVAAIQRPSTPSTSADQSLPSTVAAVPAAGTIAAAAVGATPRAIKRYQDAYLVASSLDAEGQTIKTMAQVVTMLISVLAVILAIVAGQFDGRMSLCALAVGAITATIVWPIIHGHGVRVAAEAQHLLACLDVAVHTSPFLSDSQRGVAMSL